MKIDFHTHTKLAKKLPFSSIYTDWLFDEAHKLGLDAIAITEHFNTNGFAEVYSYIHSNYEKVGDFYRAKSGLIIIPGMEIDIKEGGHTIILGKMEHILDINKRLEKNKNEANFLTFKELVKLIREYDVIFGAAHPYRGRSNIPTLKIEYLRCFDFVDLNGKDTAIDKNGNIERVRVLSNLLNRPILCGSDTHQSFQYGCVWSNFKNNFYTFEELKSEIKLGNYVNYISDDIYAKVKSAATLKKALKELYFLGYDYISILVDSKIDTSI